MADTANTFTSLLPDMKDSYAKKMEKAATKPNNKRYFNLIKKKLKERNKAQG